MAVASAQFPPGFSPQSSGLSQYAQRVDQPVAEILAHYASHPEETEATFVETMEDRFRVGWFDNERRNVLVHRTLPHGIADYLLLSFDKVGFRRHARRSHRGGIDLERRRTDE